MPDPNQPDRIYRSFDFGKLLPLHMLDTRTVGRDKQPGYAEYARAGGFAAAGFAAAAADPAWQLMGAAQTHWLHARMAQSSATWQVKSCVPCLAPATARSCP